MVRTLYHENSMAKRIGLFVNNLDEEYQISVFQGVRKAARQLGFHLICIQGEIFDEQRSTATLPSLRSVPLDAALLLSSVIVSEQEFGRYSAVSRIFEDIPVVSIGSSAFGLPSVVVDSTRSMQEMMKHLISHHAFRKFLYLGGPKNHEDNLIREGIFDVEIARSRVSDPNIEAVKAYGAYSEFSGYQEVHSYIEEHPNAPLDVLVCANDNMAIGAIKAIQEKGADSPWRNCKVTGFDDIPYAKLHMPSLTTVRQPLEEMGSRSVALLKGKLEKDSGSDRIQVDSEFVVRASCGCSKDPLGSRQISELESGRFTIERHLRTVSFFGQRLAEIQDLGKMVYHLDQFLKTIGVKNYYLLTYPRHDSWPPKRGSLLYSRIRKRSGESDRAPELMAKLKRRQSFSMNEFWDALLGASFQDPGCWSIYQLRSGQEIHGMVVYEADDHLHPQVGSSSVFVANTLKRLQLLEREKQRSKELEEMVARRTQDLLSLNQELKLESTRRQEVEAEVLRISEMERLRFSMDLHDDICQRLGGISMYAKGLSRLEDVPELVQMLDETLLLTRDYAHDSYPMELRKQGLEEALNQLCGSLKSRKFSDIRYAWVGEVDIKLSPEAEINIYRIVQEALQNAIKYSEASQISVGIQVEEGSLSVRVEDDGKGFSEMELTEGHRHYRSRRPMGLGLRSMRYRAHQLNAEYRIHSTPGEGTKVELKIPR